MAIYETVNDIINNALVEVGLDPVNDVFESNDSSVRQMRFLLSNAGRSLLTFNYAWRDLIKEHVFTTVEGDGAYALPTDFGYMIPQTNWNRTAAVPTFGPLSPQDWQYLEGRNLSSQRLYISFRLQDGKFRVYPNDPETAGQELAYEYVRNTWVRSNDGAQFFTSPQASNDVVLYQPVMIKQLLKAMWLEAKGFDSRTAREEFKAIFLTISAQDDSAPVLNAGSWGRSYPYLDSFYNTPDTGYGTY